MDFNLVWFILIVVLFTGFFILEGFDYGVGMLLIGRSESERTQLIRSIGPIWHGNSVFADYDIFALPQVKKDMEKDAVTAFERNKPHLGDLIGDKAVLPNKILESNFSVDGVEFKVREVKNTEASLIATLEIDAEKILFASDLAYGKIHLYIAENHIDEWIKELKILRQKNYNYVFAGHGAENSPETLEQTEKYLECAAVEIRDSKTFEEFEQKMLTHYPDYAGKTLLHANGMFLKF